jgi:hypothetical protein
MKSNFEKKSNQKEETLDFASGSAAVSETVNWLYTLDYKTLTKHLDIFYLKCWV